MPARARSMGHAPHVAPRLIRRQRATPRARSVCRLPSSAIADRAGARRRRRLWHWQWQPHARWHECGVRRASLCSYPSSSSSSCSSLCFALVLAGCRLCSLLVIHLPGPACVRASCQCSRAYVRPRCPLSDAHCELWTLDACTVRRAAPGVSSETRVPDARVRSRTRIPASRIKNQESRTTNQEPRVENRESRIENQESPVASHQSPVGRRRSQDGLPRPKARVASGHTAQSLRNVHCARASWRFPGQLPVPSANVPVSRVSRSECRDSVCDLGVECPGPTRSATDLLRPSREEGM